MRMLGKLILVKEITACLLDYSYLKENCKLIAMNTTKFFIIEEVKETILDFS